MTRNIIAGIIVAIATIVSQPALADAKNYECDAPAGGYSNTDIRIGTTSFKISGTVTAESFRHSGYLPVANISLADREGHTVWLRLNAQSVYQKAPTYVIFETTNVKKPILRTLGKVPFGQSMTFTIDASMPGKLMVVANSKMVEVKSELENVSTLSISCSTGTFKFANLNWSDK